MREAEAARGDLIFSTQRIFVCGGEFIFLYTESSRAAGMRFSLHKLYGDEKLRFSLHKLYVHEKFFPRCAGYSLVVNSFVKKHKLALKKKS